VNKSTLLGYVDTLWNLILMTTAVIVFFMVAHIAEEVSKNNIENQTKYMITLEWDGHSKNDMDLWLQRPPDEQVVWFHNVDTPLINLERDDVGEDGDTVIDSNGKRVAFYQNKEVIYIRSEIPGHYVVNVMFYSPKDADRQTEKVTVKLIEVTPNYRERIIRQLDFSQRREEKTAFRFDIDKNGLLTYDTISEDFAVETLQTWDSSHNQNYSGAYGGGMAQ
jgi:hypothetical protein